MDSQWVMQGLFSKVAWMAYEWCFIGSIALALVSLLPGKKALGQVVGSGFALAIGLFGFVIAPALDPGLHAIPRLGPLQLSAGWTWGMIVVACVALGFSVSQKVRLALH